MSTIETPAVAAIPQGTWTIDPAHSSVEFSVKHMGIATVRGQFSSFEGALESDGENVSVSGTVDAASIDTRNEQRDQHLVSPDFFEVEKHPAMTFASTAIKSGEEGFILEGDLTIKDVT
ncbi:MAG TPA: YceI family protein, partial [Thermoleophilaceae bacterium]|nr:YceI family protein [Thermoleophilaceae bacterium]